MKKIKDKLKKLGVKWNFQTLVIILVLIVVVLGAINTIFVLPRLESILNDTTRQLNDNFTHDSESENSVNIKSIDYVDTEKKFVNINEVMPYRSDAFDVNYDSVHNTYKIYINPASTATREDIISWFASFPDIANPSILKLEFVEVHKNGAPVN